MAIDWSGENEVLRTDTWEEYLEVRPGAVSADFLVPEYDPVGPKPYPGGILPGYYTRTGRLVLVTEHFNNAPALRFIADIDGSGDGSDALRFVADVPVAGRVADTHYDPTDDTPLAVLERVTNYLAEAHAEDKAADHYGDDSCSYCEAIDEARAILAKAEKGDQS